MQSHTIRAAALAAAFCAAPLAAQAFTLDFGSGPTPPSICSSQTDGSGPMLSCADWSYLSQSYGDVAGVVDVTYSAPRYTPAESLRWWAGNYNSLYGVLFASGSDADSLARIEIRALQPEATVTLTGLDLGAFPNTTRSTQLNVYAIGGGTPLFSYSGNVGEPGDLPTHFSFNLTVPGGLWIEYRDSAYNVGIDNIDFSLSAVPEPKTWALWAAGLAAIGGLASRRRAR